MKKNKDGLYVFRASKTINGQRFQKTFKAPTKKALQLIVSEWKNDCRASEGFSMPLREGISQYIESVDGLLSPSTIRLYNTMYLNCYHEIENIRIADLTDMIVQRWITKQSQTYSLKYLKNMLSLMTIVCKHYGKTFSVKLPQKQKQERTLPDLTDIQNILVATEGTRIEGQIRFALYLGLRQSEIYSLQWDDISDNRITIHSAKVMDKTHHYVTKGTKTFAGTRTLTIPDPLMGWIQAHRGTGQIFDTTPCHVNRIWARIRQQKSLPNIRIHDLRKANASILLLLGVPDKYIMQRLGWADYSTMKNIYQYVFQSEQSKLDSQVNDFFNQLNCTKSAQN